MIVLTQVGSSSTLYSYYNLGDYRTLGGKVRASWQNKKLNLSTGFAFTGRNDGTGDTTEFSSYLFSPETNFEARYSSTDRRWVAVLNYKHTGSLPSYVLDGDELIVARIEEYHTLDASFTYFLMKRKFAWTLGGKNLFDVREIDLTGSSYHGSSISTVPLKWGRTIYTSLKINLKWDQ